MLMAQHWFIFPEGERRLYFILRAQKPKKLGIAHPDFNWFHANGSFWSFLYDPLWKEAPLDKLLIEGDNKHLLDLKKSEWMSEELESDVYCCQFSCQRRRRGWPGVLTGLAQQGAEVWCREWEVTAQCHTAHRVSPHQAGRERDGGREGGRTWSWSQRKKWELHLRLWVCVCVCDLLLLSLWGRELRMRTGCLEVKRWV